MYKLIILASFALSASLASAGGYTTLGPKLDRVFGCAATVEAKYSEQELKEAGRLQTQLDYFLQMVEQVGDADKLRVAFGMSADDLYARMEQAIDGLLTAPRVSLTVLRSEVGSIVNVMNRAQLNPDVIIASITKPMKPKMDMSGKRKMETRMFGEDWSDLDRTARHLLAPESQKLTGSDKPVPMLDQTFDNPLASPHAMNGDRADGPGIEADQAKGVNADPRFNRPDPDDPFRIHPWDSNTPGF